MRRGLRTTEFWITALGTVGAIAGCIVGIVPASAAATVVAVGGAAYALSRGLAKIAGSDEGKKIETVPPSERGQKR